MVDDRGFQQALAKLLHEARVFIDKHDAKSIVALMNDHGLYGGSFGTTVATELHVEFDDAVDGYLVGAMALHIGAALADIGDAHRLSAGTAGLHVGRDIDCPALATTMVHVILPLITDSDGVDLATKAAYVDAGDGEGETVHIPMHGMESFRQVVTIGSS